MPGGVVVTPQNPPLAKLPDAQRIGLRHHGHAALEPPPGLGDPQALHQQMQDQHPGDFVGMHTRLHMHLRPVAIALETPGTDLHRFAVVIANVERNILNHALALP